VQQALHDAVEVHAVDACFIECSLHSGWSCNTFTMLQLPVGTKSGLLIMLDGQLTALQVIQHFCGMSFLNATSRAIQACLQQGDAPAQLWYDDSKWG